VSARYERKRPCILRDKAVGVDGTRMYLYICYPCFNCSYLHLYYVRMDDYVNVVRLDANNLRIKISMLGNGEPTLN